MLTKLTTIPLFPLGQTLYPSGALDLKIFEVRYLDMVKDCIANSTTFGIVTLDEGKEIAEPGDKSTVFFPTGTLVDITHFDSPQPSLFFIKCHNPMLMKLAWLAKTWALRVTNLAYQLQIIEAANSGFRPDG